MALRQFSIQDVELNEKFETFMRELKTNEVTEPYDIGMGTLKILRKVIAQCRWRNPSELIAMVREQGKRLKDSQPSETIISNMTGRVLKLIRDECRRLMSEGHPAANETDLDFGLPSNQSGLLGLPKLATKEEEDDDHLKKEVPNLKAAVMEAISELITELDISMENICSQALEHIHASEIILTAGRSLTVENFLRKAAKKRKFQLIVVEGAPYYQGHRLAKRLADEGIETSVITDSEVFALMSRVNKVIIGTHVVFADGGLKAPCGTFTIAQCAKFFSVPVVVCTSMFKFSQKHSCMDDFNKFLSPHDVLPYAEGEIAPDVQICNPVFEYVPPVLITFYVTNIGGHATGYVYRLVQDLFCVEDNNFI